MYIFKKSHFNFVNPHAAILKTPVWGLPASTVLRCVTLFNHIDSGMPYSAIYVYILLIDDFMHRRAGILVISV